MILLHKRKTKSLSKVYNIYFISMLILVILIFLANVMVVLDYGNYAFETLTFYCTGTVYIYIRLSAVFTFFYSAWFFKKFYLTGSGGNQQLNKDKERKVQQLKMRELTCYLNTIAVCMLIFIIFNLIVNIL